MSLRRNTKYNQSNGSSLSAHTGNIDSALLNISVHSKKNAMDDAGKKELIVKEVTI